RCGVRLHGSRRSLLGLGPLTGGQREQCAKGDDRDAFHWFSPLACSPLLPTFRAAAAHGRAEPTRPECTRKYGDRRGPRSSEVRADPDESRRLLPGCERAAAFMRNTAPTAGKADRSRCAAPAKAAESRDGRRTKRPVLAGILNHGLRRTNVAQGRGRGPGAHLVLLL